MIRSLNTRVGRFWSNFSFREVETRNQITSKMEVSHLSSVYVLCGCLRWQGIVFDDPGGPFQSHFLCICKENK